MSTTRWVAFLSIFAVAIPLTSQAEETINPWRDCGIGAMIFPRTPAGAVISNVIWDLGTTAITSQASSPDTCEGETVKTALFIQESYPFLEEQTATGTGPHLHAMLDLLGCEKSSHEQIIGTIRADFRRSLTREGASATTRTEQAQHYYNIVTRRVNTDFYQRCRSS